MSLPAVTPTQVVHPQQALLRTVLQVIVGLAAAAPVLVANAGWSTTVPAVALILGVSAVITRIMSIPLVNVFLSNIGLGATPK